MDVAIGTVERKGRLSGTERRNKSGSARDQFEINWKKCKYENERTMANNVDMVENKDRVSSRRSSFSTTSESLMAIYAKVDDFTHQLEHFDDGTRD
jgi:hypothetical protein